MATHDDHEAGDIEKQLLHPQDQSSPTTSSSAPTTTTQINPTPSVVVVDNNDNDNDKADMKAESAIYSATAAATATASSVPPKKEDSFIFNLLFNTIIVLVCLIIIPFFIVYLIGSICLTGSLKWPDECFSENNQPQSTEHRPKGIYKKMQDFESTKEKIQHLNLLTTTRLGVLALLWLVVNLCVPRLTHVALFNYPLWKWSFLVVVIFLGYPFTVMFTAILSATFVDFKSVKQHNLDYFIKGLEISFGSFLHFTLMLLLWVFYFRTDHGLHPSKRVDKFGSWTFVSLLVGGVLWVLKSATLLEWKANAVYKRFKTRILTAGFQLYFLSIIIDGLYFSALLPWRGDENQDQSAAETSTNVVSDGAKDSKNLRIQDHMLSKPVSVDQIDLVARYVTDLAKVTLRENDGIPEIVAKCREKIPSQDGGTVQYITKQALEEFFKLGEDDAQLLLQELKGEQMSTDGITFDTFQKWMVDAHKNCLSVGYTLIDAFAVVSVLNRVIIGFIAVVVILVWLLITGLATTKVIVLIASPLLALSFVFGDTCKTFFQGIIFSFVTHPYDVGDRCIIEGMELEVKRIGILTTIFVRIGTKEKMIYPNTSLATKLITNLEGEPDPSDMIDLILDSSTTKLKILGLKRDLESFFESDDRHGSYEKAIHVVVKEIGSSIKVSIRFTHIMNVQDVSHSQCLQRKNIQRSELLIEIKQFLEDQQIKLATP